MRNWKRFVPLVAVSFFSNIVRADDVDTIYNRQVEFILSTTTPSSHKIGGYINTLQPDGSWSTVNYAAGCEAQRSSWPAGSHWSRILEMAAAYRGTVPEYTNNPELRSAIRRAMEYWFANDYSTIGDGSCMDRQFLPGANCPCGTPGLWGPNWYSNVIQVPTRAGKACTLLRADLTETELGNCTLITSRAYAPFYRDPQPVYVSGANVIDMAVIGISAGFLENNRAGNATRIGDAYARVHEQVAIQAADRVDGIKPDGSFQQHTGIIYDGNYGKDFSNSLLELELQALGTQFQAEKGDQDVFGLHLGGARWMTYTNVLTGIVHWDLTVIGRYITYPVFDLRASANLRMDLGQVLTLGKAWNQQDLIKFGSELTGNGDNSANSGNLIGNRMFWSSDYMVHRTESTVTTVKMLSNRTTTSECVNAENPFGFHLSDGVVYTYSTGAEYEDMFATLDYNIPPGITTDYGATPMECSTTARQGADPYAGGVQAGDVGMAAMRYVNPLTQSFGFNKAWFFFPENVQHVLVSNVQQSDPSSTAPIFSVLDQRLRSGDVYVNGEPISGSGNFSEAGRIWHAGTGYIFPPDQAQSTQLSVSLETKTGDWRKISLSRAPPSTKDMFVAWVVHSRSGSNFGHHRPPKFAHSSLNSNLFSPVEYSVFPATQSDSDFANKAARLRPRTVINSEVVSAAMDSRAMILGAAFWSPAGGAVTINEMGIRIEVDRAVVLMLKFEDEGRHKGTVSVADPTHGTGQVNVKITWTSLFKGHRRRRREGPVGRQCSIVPRAARRTIGSLVDAVALSVNLPEGGLAGSTVMIEFERGSSG